RPRPRAARLGLVRRDRRRLARGQGRARAAAGEPLARGLAGRRDEHIVPYLSSPTSFARGRKAHETFTLRGAGGSKFGISPSPEETKSREDRVPGAVQDRGVRLAFPYPA